MRGRPEYAETSGAADRGDHVAAMAESQQRKFDSQHVADWRFHRCVHPRRPLFGQLVLDLNLRSNASASEVEMPSGASLRSRLLAHRLPSADCAGDASPPSEPTAFRAA